MAKFCPECGTPLNNPNAKFCPNCGTRIEVSGTAVPVSQTVPAEQTDLGKTVPTENSAVTPKPKIRPRKARATVGNAAPETVEEYRAQTLLAAL